MKKTILFISVLSFSAQTMCMEQQESTLKPDSKKEHPEAVKELSLRVPEFMRHHSCITVEQCDILPRKSCDMCDTRSQNTLYKFTWPAKDPHKGYLPPPNTNFSLILQQEKEVQYSIQTELESPLIPLFFSHNHSLYISGPTAFLFCLLVPKLDYVENYYKKGSHSINNYQLCALTLAPSTTQGYAIIKDIQLIDSYKCICPGNITLHSYKKNDTAITVIAHSHNYKNEYEFTPNKGPASRLIQMSNIYFNFK